MQLWQMLGRKSNNLGRVVDGDQNASMGAKKAGQDGTGAGLSVQDELQSFFAETKVQDERESKIPVKGTIMSFFAKQQQQTPRSKSKALTGIRTESTKKTPSFQKSSMFCNSSNDNLQMVDWDCEVCTFHNKQHRRFSDVLACEMCGNKYQEAIEIDDEEEITSRRVTSAASVRKGDLRKNNQVSKLSSVKKRTRQSICSSNPKIVSIDGTEKPGITVVPRNLDSSLETPDVLCGHQEKQLSRKKQKSNNGQVQSKIREGFPISNDRGPNSASATTLSFSVSRNSGRITIHFSDSGESSLTNFKVEQIVTEETTDRLMEARLIRNRNAMASIRLDYNQSALSKGKQVEPLNLIDIFRDIFSPMAISLTLSPERSTRVVARSHRMSRSTKTPEKNSRRNPGERNHKFCRPIYAFERSREETLKGKRKPLFGHPSATTGSPIDTQIP